MKRAILLCGMFLLVLCDVAEANGTKAYRVMNDVINSSMDLATVSDYEPSANDSPSDMMFKCIMRKDKFISARSKLAKYERDGDKVVKQISEVICSGVDVLIGVNGKSLEILRGLSNHDEKYLKDFDYQMAQMRADNKAAWEVIGKGLTMSWPIFVEFKKTENPTGLLPFKITNEERQKLIKKIDDFFAPMLNRYYAYRATVDQGGKGNPADQTWLIVGIDEIRKILVKDSY